MRHAIIRWGEGYGGQNWYIDDGAVVSRRLNETRSRGHLHLMNYRAVAI